MKVFRKGNRNRDGGEREWEERFYDYASKLPTHRRQNPNPQMSSLTQRSMHTFRMKQSWTNKMREPISSKRIPLLGANL